MCLYLSCICPISVQTHCQEDDEDSPYPLEEGTAEYDNIIQESAGSCLGPLAALVGGERFIPKLQPLLPRLFRKLVRMAFRIYFTNSSPYCMIYHLFS